MLLIVTWIELNLLNVNDFPNVNETRIKVLSSYPSGHVDIQCPVDKKSYEYSGQKIGLMLWIAVAKVIYNK